MTDENPHAPWPIAKQIANEWPADDRPFNRPKVEELVAELIDLVGPNDTRKLIAQARQRLQVIIQARQRLQIN